VRATKKRKGEEMGERKKKKKKKKGENKRVCDVRVSEEKKGERKG
jgi:hypothetical protein